MKQEILQQLQAPFAFEDIETVVQLTNSDKTKGLAVFRHNAQAVQARLDAVIGHFDWRNEHILQDKTCICGLSLHNIGRGEWVAKYGGTDEVQANSFVQSAELWGIGRYLRRIGGVWVDIEKCDGGYRVKENKQDILKSAYDKAVAKIFGTDVPQNTPEGKPEKSEVPNACSQKAQPQPVEPTYDYKVRSVKSSGKSSQLLELVDRNGKVTAAYIKTGGQAVTVGSCLTNVDIQQKSGAYGDYNLINACRVAA